MQELLFAAMRQNNQEVLKTFSKYFAIAIRNEMEDFHVEHLTDKQMAELNPLIRNAIYNALFALSNAHRSDYCRKLVQFNMEIMPPYWEDPELIPKLKKISKNIAKPLKTEFQSKFLNEQLQYGNILLDPIAQCVRIITSFEFKEVPGDKHRHRDKIAGQLRKEGFQYSDALAGYIKKIT